MVVSFGTALCLDPQREQELTREVARKQTARQLLEAGVDNYRWSSLSERALANSARPLVLVPGEFTSSLLYLPLYYVFEREKKDSYNTKYTELKIYKSFSQRTEHSKSIIGPAPLDPRRFCCPWLARRFQKRNRAVSGGIRRQKQAAR